MNDVIEHPDHYGPRFTLLPLECIDVARYLGFCPGSAFKYLWRSGRKGDAAKRIEDLKKAKKYLEWLIGDDHPVTGDTIRARTIFRQIESPTGIADEAERTVYMALFLIVYGQFDGALAKVETLLRHYEAEGGAEG